MVRKAFTMIELVFAIVIISISVLSLPTIMQVNSRAMEQNLVQEAIFASISEINTATTYVWDDNSLDDDVLGFSRVLPTSSTDCNTSSKRVGHIHRQCVDAYNNLALYTTTNGDVERGDAAIDGVNNTHDWKPLFVSTSNTGDVTAASSSETGYKTIYNSKLSAGLSSLVGKQFGLEADNKNIKEIVVEVAQYMGVTDGNVTVTLLRTYVANIGEVKYHSLNLP